MYFYLISYDISSPERQRKVRNVLAEYGIPVQKSVFECGLNSSDFNNLLEYLEQIMEESSDTLRVYQICKTCRPRIISLGLDKNDIKQEFFII